MGLFDKIRSPGSGQAVAETSVSEHLSLDGLAAVIPQQAGWESLVVKAQKQFGGLRTKAGDGWLVQSSVDLGVQAVRRFDASTLWRRHLPEGLRPDEMERYRERLRLGFFMAVMMRALGQGVSGIRVESGGRHWQPIGHTTFRGFVDSCNGEVPEVRYEVSSMHGGEGLLVAHALFGRQDVHERVGTDVAQEVFVYLAPGGRDTLFGQLMGEAEDIAGVSPDVAAMFLQVLRQDVEERRLEINCNPGDLFVFEGWLFLVYPAAFKKVLRHLRSKKGCDVHSRDGLLLELIREGVLLTHEGYNWEVPDESSWGMSMSPAGVIMGEVLFPGNMSTSKLRGLAFRQTSLWEEDPDLALFDGGIEVKEIPRKES